MRSARRAIVALSIVLVSATGCAASPEPPAVAPLDDADSRLGGAEPSTLVEGLAAPWSIAFHDDVALVSERDSGRIVAVDAAGGTSEVGVIDDVAAGGEGGLLGLAVRGDDLAVYLTTSEGNRIDRYRLVPRAGRLGLGPAETLLAGLPSAGTHNGGRIAFGPDGMLYATVGDAGDRDAAQDEDALAGKILRITPDGDVPEDNPFAGSPVYSLGHRNPQGLAWDDTGTLYASEFGQDTWDELNVIEPGGNYGWPEVEGIAERDGFIDPVQQWRPDDASPSGMAIAAGAVFLANLRGERLREVPLDALDSAAEHLTGDYGRLRDVVVAPDGDLWILTNNTDGRGSPSDGDDRVLVLPLDGTG